MPWGPPRRTRSPLRNPPWRLASSTSNPVGQTRSALCDAGADAVVGLLERLGQSDCSWRSTASMETARTSGPRLGVSVGASRLGRVRFGARPSALPYDVRDETRDRRLSACPDSLRGSRPKVPRERAACAGDTEIGPARAGSRPVPSAPGLSSFASRARTTRGRRLSLPARQASRKETHGAARQGSSRRGARGFVPGVDRRCADRVPRSHRQAAAGPAASSRRERQLRRGEEHPDPDRGQGGGCRRLRRPPHRSDRHRLHQRRRGRGGQGSA